MISSAASGFDVFNKEKNNFNLVRLFAALAVIYAHSHAISPTPGLVDVIAAYTGGVAHSGSIAVDIFFFLSGALVLKSLVETPDLSGFVLKRVMRIYPGLIVCCAIVTFLVAPIFGGQDFFYVFSQSQAWRYFYMNSLAVWNEHVIPGIFSDHPYQGLNGSLWSVTLEVRLYFVLALFGLFGLAVSRKIIQIALFSSILLIAICPGAIPILGNNQDTFGNYDFPSHAIIFFIGGLYYLLHDSFKFTKWTLLVSIFLMLLTRGTPAFPIMISTVGITLALLFGTSRVALRFPLQNDLSYGVYLYGWPSQQITRTLFPHSGPHLNAAVAMIIALGLAALSWRLVERPCINLAHALAKKGFPFRKQPSTFSERPTVAL
ncbi:acyltransferase [Nitrospirillum sp. BR 11828]|uniref:acyltransferase family protein n=1 Tax=Nitrospirillum sp. BR 11828 TaxID=3104325 RepID=UPI002ACA2405|nr:acyltransferase [Nitrospirillum sp. BR 11828]MDZ5650601.1 acyltransferase [Nitrospirillum sp. BR 11828]